MPEPDLDAIRARVPKPDGCCGDGAWRGHLCAYHEGAADAAEEVDALVMAHQVGEGYAKGYEHGRAAGLRDGDVVPVYVVREAP